MSAAMEPEFDVCSANGCHGSPVALWKLRIFTPVAMIATVALCERHDRLAIQDAPRYGVTGVMDEELDD